jgi:uncharacterized protein (DUF2062 family)
VFRRRTPLPLLQRFSTWLWPHIGWGRATSYVVMRLKRMPGTPHSIAAGFATGVAVSFTPFFPHIASATLVAMLCRGSVIAAWVGTVIGNPSTFPIIWLATYNLGLILMGREPVSDSEFHAQSQLASLPAPFTLEWANGWIERAAVWVKAKFVPMAVGGVPLGILAGLLCYLPLVRFVGAFQEARRRRAERLKERPAGVAVGRAPARPKTT